jgi:hypothetical protein
MSKRPQDTSAEEPDGGNPHIRFRGGPRRGNSLGLLNEATSKGWSERRNVIGHVLKFGLPIQRVRIPSGQSVDPQAGSEPCSGTGNRPVDA